MSAPPLDETGPISGGTSFYNVVEAQAPFEEIVQDVGQETLTSEDNHRTPGLRGSIPECGFNIAADLDSVQAPYTGEDGRITLLRQLDTIFREMAGNFLSSCGSIPHQTVKLLPGISRAVIQFVSELQAKYGQLQISYEQQKAIQENLQTSKRQMRAHISWLEREREVLKDANWKLKFKIQDVKRDMCEVERSYQSIKAQKDELKAELDGLKLGATSDSGDGPIKKRSRKE